MIAVLYRNGIMVALPISDHLAFDLIAIARDGRLSRVSVKHRKLDKDGKLQVSLKTVYKNSLGNHVKVADKRWYDAVAVFCPDTERCYFFKSVEIPSGGVRSLDQKELEKFEATGKLFEDRR